MSAADLVSCEGATSTNEMEMAKNGLSVEFEAGVLLPTTPASPSTRAYKTAWLLKSLDVNSASSRYRCYHFAHALTPNFDSEYFTSAYDLEKRLHEFDAVIIVKRIDKAIPGLVAQARSLDVPVFLDLCDDLIAPGYVKNGWGVNLVRFLGIAPFLAAVTVPSAEMADRVQGYASENGLPELPVRVVPDIAETWDLFRATHEAVTGEDLPAQLPAPDADTSGRRKVIWFGNFGASHSNFGIFSLRPTLKSLRIVNHDIPLELVIVSNNKAVYDSLVRGCGFPTRYVSWSAPAVYSELQSSDVALLTTGDDEFCDIKSSCRVLQAFAAGVPVITSKGSAVSEFEDAIALGRMRDALRLCLGPSRLRFVPARLAAAQRILPRYTPERIAGIWSDLLTNSITRNQANDASTARNKLLIVLDRGESLASARALLSMLKQNPSLDYALLVSTELLEKEPAFGDLLRLSPRFPRFFTGELEGLRNLLPRCAAVVVRPSAPTAQAIRRTADHVGVPVIATEDAASGAVTVLNRGVTGTPRARSVIQPGAFDERLETDGSAEWCFLVNEKARGWILDAICREIGSRQPESWYVSYVPGPVPPARNYFFSHYAVLQNFVDLHADELAGANSFVWYTHPRTENPVSIAKLLLAFDHVTKVVFACEANRQLWLERGLPEEKTAVVLGAADPELFRYHERGGGVVGLSSSFYERKNPDCLLEVMKLLPHRDFLLLGRKWNQYALFEEMRALPNFTYRSAPYREYPDIYSQFDVFLSMSTLEGGPIPLVEAMMSNAVPVASRTGFAPDLIRHGENGFIFDLDAPAARIAEMVEAAFRLPGDIRKTVEKYSWDNFSSEIVKLTK